MNNKVSINFRNYWKDFGYQDFGLCLRSNNIFYVPIPKNASSNLRETLINHDWLHDNFIDNIHLTNYTSIVVLRNPIDRWVSGINQYFHLYHPNIKSLSSDLLSVICNKIIMDDHTEKQTYFCNGLDISTSVFFEFNNNLSNNLNHYFAGKITFKPFSFINQLSTIEQQLKQCLTDKLIKKIKTIYECDYDLISQTRFYDTR